MIGVGMQGSGLLRTSVAIPGVECAAACDLYDGRHTLAREIAGANIRTTRRYQELLGRQEHRLHRGRGARSLAQEDRGGRRERGQGHLLREADVPLRRRGVRDGGGGAEVGRLVQIGSQRTSSALCAKAREIIAAGALGDIT